MSVHLKSRLKLRPSVAVTKSSGTVEFFLSDIRKTISLELSNEVAELLFSLDGKKTLSDWFNEKEIIGTNQEAAIRLFDFLQKYSVLIDSDMEYGDDYARFPRVYSFLENFCGSHSQVSAKMRALQRKRVMIIGLGSVGTWVAYSLLMSGIRHFVLVDHDVVEISNLHRQFGFALADVGKKKVMATKKHMLERDPDAEILLIDDALAAKSFSKWDLPDLDLMINCADYPTVDETSQWIGDFCMRKGIPHIIGGGYNLHLSLVGQVVIPGETACVQCFRKNLEEINVIDTSNVYKLENRERKVGSFPPLSALSASITANEAFKILSGIGGVIMANKRTEFLLSSMNFNTIRMERREDCEWCGKNGEFYHL